MKIIVISITPYKEKDGIVDAISENGAITFLARSIFDPKSKTASLNTNLTIADIDLQEGNFKYPILRSVSSSLNPMLANNDLNYLASLLIIAECSKNLLQDEEKEIIYNFLLETVKNIKNSDKPFLLTLSYLSHLLKVAGYEFDVNRCVFCGTKQGIATFSFEDGGFVCKNCMNEETEKDLTTDQMFLLRQLFLEESISLNSKYYGESNCLVLLNKYHAFIKDNIGFDIKSFHLINK